MIVETTNYFARDGQAAQVLAQRRKATEIRKRLGLDPGRILVRIEGGGPDVCWQCSFASRQDYEADMSARGGSQAFADARKAMHLLLERFERHVYQTDD